MMMTMMTMTTTMMMMMMTMITTITERGISILRKEKNLMLNCMGKKILLLLKKMS